MSRITAAMWMPETYRGVGAVSMGRGQPLANEVISPDTRALVAEWFKAGPQLPDVEPARERP